MEIRQATIADIPVLVALNRIAHAMHVEAFPDTFRRDPPDEAVSAAFKAAMESTTSYWLLAEEEERAVAFLSADFWQRAETWYRIAQRVCYIGGIVVEPDYRRKGIARALVVKLKHEAVLVE